MKILHIINDLNSGGAEKLLTDILPIMKQAGHEVNVCISNGQKNIDRYETILKDQEVKIIDFKTSFYNPLLIIKFYKLIVRNNYDIIHAHLFPSQYWLSFSSLFFKSTRVLIKTEHSVYNERKEYKWLKPLEKFVYSRYTRIIGITDKVMENLKSWIKRNDIIVVKNGVNLKQVRAAKESKLPNDLVVLNKEKDFKILMTGRFDGSQKDQKTLIDALELIDSNIQLYFAGTGPYLEKLKDYVTKLKTFKNIHFLGMRTDIYAIMANVDLNILSTNHEGLSGVTLESLASGKPFIGTDVEGVNDVVPNNSFLFPKSNPKILAEKILEIKNNEELRSKLIREGLVHVKSFDIPFMANRYLEVYKDELENVR